MPLRFKSLHEEVVLGYRLLVAATLPSRLLGLALLGTRPPVDGLLLPGCRTVHTFGMRFDLTVIFIDRIGRPVGRVEGLGPGRIVGHRKANAVAELPEPPATGGEKDRRRKS